MNLRRLLGAGAPLTLLAALALGLPALAAWQTGTALERRIDVQARELDRQLGQLALVPRLLSDDPRLLAALADRSANAPASPGSVDVANALLARAQARSGLAFAFLMDANGITVASSNHRDPLSFVGADYGFRPYFQTAMTGREASYFAVGATTGRPGYFVAVPVFDVGATPRSSSASPIGVIVGKVELDALVDAWRADRQVTLVLDTRGVVILSTDPALLYVPERTPGVAERRRIDAERIYTVVDGATLGPSSGIARNRRWDSAQGGVHTRHWLGAERSLVREPWTLLAMVPSRSVLWRAAGWGVALVGLLAIAVLAARVLAQRRRILSDAAESAERLERLVDARTAELASAQRALIARSSFEMLGRLSAAINHEINQPLASLRLNLASARALLSREPPPLDEIAQAVVDSDRTTRRIGRVVATLRGVAGPPVTMDSCIELTTVLRELAETLERERPAAAGRLRIEPVRASVAIRGNAVLLQQALLNLVDNALDVVLDQADGCVTVSVAQVTRERVTIAVSDNGPGVPDVLRDTLFEPFARGEPGIADERPSGAGQGLGLGLALARQIAERHGGSLDCTASSAVGSVFSLVLPLFDEARPQQLAADHATVLR